MANVHFIYNLNGQLINETHLNASQKEKDYLYLDNTPIALVTGNELYFIHTDHLGTPRNVTNAAQQSIWQWHSTPFGQQAANDDPDGDGVKFELNLRFPGQYFDEETGLHYNYFRDYDPATGRYVQSDPIGLAGGINTYGYAYQSPINYIDPYGLNPIVKVIIDKILKPNRKQKKTKKSANKRDKKQVDDAARDAGIPKNRRRDFGDFIEDIKPQESRGGRDNFDFDELLELAKEFKDTQCQ